MIKYLCHDHGYTMVDYLAGPAESLADEIIVESYRKFLAHPNQALCSSYIFSDIERVPDSGLDILVAYWQQLAALDFPIRLLNHPKKALKRRALLNKLSELGINDFNVYPIRKNEIPEVNRFPVFIRRANDHRGPLSQLIKNQDELIKYIEHLHKHKWVDDLIVTEFVDASDEAGIYKKFGAFRIGDRIVPTHILLENTWLVKDGDLEPSPEYVTEEYDFVTQNPHEHEIRNIFEIANIDYGRIDYGFSQGRMQVFEINTNPLILGLGLDDFDSRIPRRNVVSKQVEDAFLALNHSLS